MPAVCIKNKRFSGCIKEILNALPDLPEHNWLITDLECYDYCGWDGCEKWAESRLFLSDEELRHDVNLRDMQFVWGTFSALPKNITKEEALTYPDIWLDSNDDGFMLKNILLPQQQNAIIEIWSVDSTYVMVVAHNPDYLKPFYDFDCDVYDNEIYNQKMNSELCRIRNAIKMINSDIPENKVNAIQWHCWRNLFLDSDKYYDDEAVAEQVEKSIEHIEEKGFYDSGFYWNPLEV